VVLDQGGDVREAMALIDKELFVSFLDVIMPQAVAVAARVSASSATIKA
jgi:hypothetical protein